MWKPQIPYQWERRTTYCYKSVKISFLETVSKSSEKVKKKKPKEDNMCFVFVCKVQL